jgi:GAF domain-containing protein
VNGFHGVGDIRLDDVPPPSAPNSLTLPGVATDAFSRSTAALEAETTIRGLLGAACRELVELTGGTACAISRVIGDLLVGLDEHTTSGRRLEIEHEYLISDFPLTREVVEGGEPRWLSRLDENPEANEAALLAELGFESLLMVCLPTSDGCWGLVEVYAEHGRFGEEDAEVAARLAARTGELLERLDPPGTR